MAYPVRPAAKGGKQMNFFAVFIKKEYIRNVEVFMGPEDMVKHPEETGDDTKWKEKEITGYCGLYLGENQGKACEYAAEEHGYPVDALWAENISKVVQGNFTELVEHIKNGMA